MSVLAVPVREGDGASLQCCLWGEWVGVVDFESKLSAPAHVCKQQHTMLCCAVQVLQLLLTFFRNLVTIPDRPLTGSAVEKGCSTTQVKHSSSNSSSSSSSIAAAAWQPCVLQIRLLADTQGTTAEHSTGIQQHSTG